MTTRINVPILISSFLIAMLLSVSGCIGGIVRGNGTPSTQRHTLYGFSSISTYGSVDLQVTIGNIESVELTCDSNLHEHLYVSLSNGELEFDTEPGISISPRSECVARITATQLVAVSSSGSGNVQVEGAATALSKIRTSGSGDVRVNAIGSESLEVDTSGSGNVELGGTVVHFGVKISGSGEVRARNLVAQRVNARSSGSGDIRVFSEMYIDAKTNGSGDIHVWGAPAEHYEKSTGSGEVYYH